MQIPTGKDSGFPISHISPSPDIPALTSADRTLLDLLCRFRSKDEEPQQLLPRLHLEFANLGSAERASLILYLSDALLFSRESTNTTLSADFCEWLRREDPGLSFLAELIERADEIIPRLGAILPLMDALGTETRLRRDVIEVLLEQYEEAIRASRDLSLHFHQRLQNHPEEFTELSAERVSSLPAVLPEEPASETLVLPLQLEKRGEDHYHLQFHASQGEEASHFLRQAENTLQSRIHRKILILSALHLLWLISLLSLCGGRELPNLLIALGIATPLSLLSLIGGRSTPHGSLCLAEAIATVSAAWFAGIALAWVLAFPLLAAFFARTSKGFENHGLHRLEFARLISQGLSDDQRSTNWTLELMLEHTGLWFRLSSENIHVSFRDRNNEDDDDLHLIASGLAASSQKTRVFEYNDSDSTLIADGNRVYGSEMEIAARELIALIREQ